MASKRQIGAIIKLDGESTFKASVQNCRTSISAMKAELGSIQASYSGNANGIDALSASYDQYCAIQDEARKYVEKMSTAYDESQKKTEEVKTKMREMLDVYEDAAAKLKKMQDSGDASAEELEEQKAAADKAYKGYLDYAESVEKCETRTNRFKKSLEDAKAEELDAGEAIKRYSKYIDEARESADGHATSIDKFGKELAAAGESATGASSAMDVFKGALASGFVTQGIEKVCDLLKEGASYAVEVGSEFEAAMSKVSAISGATGADLDSLKSKAEELGRSTQFSASDVSNAFSYMALAGWDVSQMLQSIDGVLNLAAAGEMDLAEASDIVTDYLSAFGLQASDSSHFVDMMATAMSSSNTNIEQLGEAYKNCAATAGQFGYSAEEATAALMTMANAGVKGGEAGTSLNALMVRLATNTKGCADELKSYGVSIYDSSGNMKSLSEILTGISSAFSTLSDEQQANLAKTIAGQNQYSSFLTVLEGMSDAARENGQSFDDYTKKLEECDGAASGMAETMNDNLKGSMRELQSAAEGLGNGIYEIFDGPLRTAAQLATDAIDSITDRISDVSDKIHGGKSELDSFVDTINDSVDANSNAVKDSTDTLEKSASRFSQIDEYINIIDELRNKTKLTSYEQYQLNGAFSYLSTNLPGVADAFGTVDDMMDKTSDDYQHTMKRLLDNSKFSEISAQRQSLMNAAAASTVNRRSAQDAVAEAKKQVKIIEDEIDKYKLTHQSGNDVGARLVDESGQSVVSYGDMIDYYNEKLRDAQDALSDYEETQLSAEQAERDAMQAVEDLDSRYESLYASTGHVIDENGNLVSSISDVTEEMNDSLNRINSDNIVRVTDDVISAMQSVQDYQQTVQSSLSNNQWLTSNKMDALLYTDDELSDKKYEILENEVSNLLAAKEYTSGLQELAERSVSDGLLNELASLGLDGVGYIQAFVSMTDSELKEYQMYWDEAQSYVEGVNERIGQTIDAYSSAVMSGVDKGYSAWYEYGIQSVQGLYDALAQVQASMQSNTSLSFADAARNALQNGRSSVQQTSSGANNFMDMFGNKLMQQINGNNGDIVLNASVNLDGDVLGTAQQRYNMRSLNRTGK